MILNCKIFKPVAKLLGFWALRKMKFHRNLTCLVLALIPFVCLVYFVAKYKVDVPYWDQWELIPLLEKSCQGRLSFSDLWAPHNEHRPFFPLTIMVTLACFSNWKISYELMTNILLGVGIFLIVTYQLRKTDRSISNHKVCWLIPIASLMIFSLSQFENWLWGWQIQIFLNVLTVAVGVVLLANYATDWLCYILALLMGIIGTYSFSNGLVYWVVGLLILFSVKHQAKRNKILKIIIWISVSVIIICTYWPLIVYKYQRPVDHTPLLFGFRYPIEFVKYVLTYLGAPICCYQVKGAVFFGLLGLFILGYSIWVLKKVRYVKVSVFIPYLAFSLYVVGGAVITGIGRAGLGPLQALKSRYVTIANLFWISNISILYILANTAGIELKNKIISKRNIILSVMMILVLFVISNSVIATRGFKRQYALLMPARAELLSPTKNDKLLKRLYPRVEIVKARAAVLKKYKLSVFKE